MRDALGWETARVRGDLPDKTLYAGLAFVFLLIVVKAASADITWDESWTFLHYGRPLLGFTRLDYANNHVLNSAAIHLATILFGPAVFTIRLPNVLSGLLYLYATAVIARQIKARAAAFAILVLNPYLIEHFALARGYGISAGILEFALARYVFTEEWRSGYGRLLALTVLASFAIGSDITIVVGLVAARATLAFGSGEGLRTGWLRPSAIACVAVMIPLAILLQETRPGVPVFGSTEGPFGAIAVGTARMFVVGRASFPLAIIVLFSLCCLLVARWRALSSRTWFLLLASVAELAFIEAGSLLFGRKLPTARLLVPSLPLWGCALVSWAEDLGAGRSRQGSAISTVVLVVLGAAFISRWHTERFIDWKEDYGLEKRLARVVADRPACIPWNVWSRYGHEYYLDQWFGTRRGLPDVPCSKPK